MMTPRQRLLRHIETDHNDGAPKPVTLAELQRWHSRQHWRFATNHRHAGPNTGPMNRPPGWKTGENVITDRQTQVGRQLATSLRDDEVDWLEEIVDQMDNDHVIRADSREGVKQVIDALVQAGYDVTRRAEPTRRGDMEFTQEQLEEIVEQMPNDDVIRADSWQGVELVLKTMDDLGYNITPDDGDGWVTQEDGSVVSDLEVRGVNYVYRDLTSPLDSPRDQLLGEIDRLNTYWMGPAALDAASRIAELAHEIALSKTHRER